jgi:hypothetical protein
MQRPPDPRSDASPKPVLFLHIPKTAGTSFLLTLQNVFGDAHVRRIRQVDDNIAATVDAIVADGLEGISCLAGHLPIHLFDTILDRFRPFTVLREPVGRVLSLYRFLRDGDPAVPRRLGLPPDFSLDAFLNWGHPEIYSQVNNGMVRMLCGDPQMVYPGNPLLWDISGHTDTLRQALRNLERIHFGLTEAMGTTLAVAQDAWGVPYALGEYHENSTVYDAAGEDIALIHRIIAMNTADLALYHRARALFQARLRAPGTMPIAGWDRLSVFAPRINQETVIGDIPGRSGFHEFEPDGLAWLHADRQAEIHFIATSDLMRLRLRAYCLIPHYPVGEIAISVNEVPLQTEVFHENEKWYWIETDHFETRDGVNRIAVRAPLFIPVTQLEPDSSDRRRLGIALSHLQIGP